jgi:hypothetical protein
MPSSALGPAALIILRTCTSLARFWYLFHNSFFLTAEGVRFELTRPFGLPVFKTGAINRSATPPGEISQTVEQVLSHSPRDQQEGNSAVQLE